jgi:hypothetical protein
MVIITNQEITVASGKVGKAKAKADIASALSVGIH